MFLRSACFGMFDFGMFKYFLLSACCIPHTHTCGQVLVLLVVDRQGSTALQQRCAAQTWQILFLACGLSSCCSCRSVLVALAQLEVADNGSNRASACLILACLSIFFCRPSTCFGMFDFGMFKFGHLHAKMRSFRHVSSFRVLWHFSRFDAIEARGWRIFLDFSLQTGCRLLRYNSCRSTGKHACSLPDYMLFIDWRAVRRYIWC